MNASPKKIAAWICGIITLLFTFDICMQAIGYSYQPTNKYVDMKDVWTIHDLHEALDKHLDFDIDTVWKEYLAEMEQREDWLHGLGTSDLKISELLPTNPYSQMADEIMSSKNYDDLANVVEEEEKEAIKDEEALKKLDGDKS